MISGTNKGLRIFSKIICFSTFLLIFVGGMVTSTGSGLSVPDWPLSYGMLFPPMVGGVFYEHGHRMVATVVGFLTLCLAVTLALKEERKWVKNLGFLALGAVILQGVLGGITVLFFLPTAISVAHGVLAQTFFILTIIIAYSQSIERNDRFKIKVDTRKIYSNFLRLSLVFSILVYIQLILGAIMRHSGSGLAIPDFPTMGGQYFPLFDKNMLANINYWRFENNLDDVTKIQVISHFVHRLCALFIVILIIPLNTIGLKCFADKPKLRFNIYLINLIVTLQVLLGILTVHTLKAPTITSLHVVTGAATLGISVLLFLRASPTKISELKERLFC